MILTDEQVIELVLHPAHVETIEQGCLLSRQHIRHVKGIGIEDYFKSQNIKGYENSEEELLRHKISRATTVPIFASALGTFDKVFSASGYSRYFDFKNGTDEMKKEFQAYLNNDLGEGLNMSQWMQNKWGDKIHYDFNGVLMVELPSLNEDELEGQQNKPYIIFKSIHDIHDYESEGVNLEYLILKAECDESYESTQNKDNSFTYFRVIDDSRDLIVRVEKGSDLHGKDGYINAVILDTPDYPIIENIWKYVPGVIISTQDDSVTEAKQSFIWQSIGTADDYLLDSSIHTISKKKHGFPQKWTYAVPCKQCDSAGKFPIYGDYKQGEDRPILSYSKCTSCNGQGSITVSPSIAVVKPMPDANNPDIGDPFGYVTPDITSMEFQTTELERLEEIIHEAIWSVIDVSSSSKGADQTATGRVLDVSAKQTKLNKFSANGERVEKFLTDTLGRAIYRDNYISSIIKWGRKYYILTENELEVMYKAAKDSGVNAAILKSYLEELIYVRYATDPLELDRQLKLFEVEPFAHMTVGEVQSLQYCAISDKYLKTYFNDYIEQIEREKPELIYTGTTQSLIDELNKLNQLKITEAKAQEPPPEPKQPFIN